jgi:membrane protease subunit HflC
MKKSAKPFIIAIAVILGLFIAGPFYVVNEGEQAVVIELGRLVRIVTDAGLYVKIPFIDEVKKYPKKIMSWDGDANLMPTSEGQFIWVDMTARWRIADPQKFYEAVQTTDTAKQKLAQVIDSAVRTVVADNSLQESVRNSNLLWDKKGTTVRQGADTGSASSPVQSESADALKTDIQEIKRGRRQLAEEILTRSRRMVPEYGIELIDVITRQIRYTNELTESVHRRMIQERKQLAESYRSDGQGKKAEWLGTMQSEQMAIRSAAEKEAQKIRGDADAEATRIYAEAYNRDRDFFNFWRAVESYRTTIPKFNKTLSTDMEYFRYLYAPR